MKYIFHKQNPLEIKAFISVLRILCCLNFIEKDDLPMVLYTLNQFARPRISNHHTFFKDLNITSLVKYPNTVPSFCNEFDAKSINENHQHIITDALGILFNDK